MEAESRYACLCLHPFTNNISRGSQECCSLNEAQRHGLSKFLGGWGVGRSRGVGFLPVTIQSVYQPTSAISRIGVVLLVLLLIGSIILPTARCA